LHVDQIFYYTVNGTSKALSFILIQSARFQCYTEFALKNPALAQKFLDDYKAENQRVAATFDGIITHMQDEWDRMSGPERTEFIFQAITEVIAMPTFQHAYLKGLDDTFNHVASHMHETFNKTPSAVTAEGIPVPYDVAAEMLQEAENPVQKAAAAAGTIEKTKAPAAGQDAPKAAATSEPLLVDSLEQRIINEGILPFDKLERKFIKALSKQKDMSVSSLKIPQGITPKNFTAATILIKNNEIIKEIGGEIFVQGSRAKGTAKLTSDIDFGIRVNANKFDILIKECFGSPTPGTATERTMLHAIKTGKIQYGEIRLRGTRLGKIFKEQLLALLGIDIDLSIIKSGSPFDNGPFKNL